MASAPRGTPGLGEGRKVERAMEKGKTGRKKQEKNDKKTRLRVCSYTGRLYRQCFELNTNISMLTWSQ